MIMSRHDWYFGERFAETWDFTDKRSNVWSYISYMLNRTQGMFEYDGLPESLPKRELELALQTNGFVAIPIPSKVEGVNGEIYAFAEGASLGGVRNVYYMPTICNIASPALEWSASLKLDDECIIIPNDSLYLGLLPLFTRYASMMAENDISIRMADINARVTSHITAPDDRTFKSAKEYLSDIESGKLGIIADESLLEKIQIHPNSTGSINSITQLIELHQYLKAGWYNEIGLNANYNMKRESINSNESMLNEDALLPLAEDMLRMRQIGFDKVNEACGTNIKVRLSGPWKVREDEMVQDNVKEVTEDEEIDRSVPELEQ